MKIEAVDVIQLRNAPAPRKGKKKLPVPDQGISTIVQIQVSNGSTKRETGLGEIRAMSFLTEESPNGAYLFARRLGAALIGKTLPTGLSGRAVAQASHELIVATSKEVFGIDLENELPDDLRPSVRLGFDCAILDAMARLAGQSVATLLGATSASVTRNVVPRSFTQPSKLLNSLLQGNRPAGWLRGGYAKDGVALAALVGAVAAATGGRNDTMKGLWFNLNSRWKPQSVGMLLEGLSNTAAIRGSGLEIVLEQPFPSRATVWYREALEMIADSDPVFKKRVRLMIGDGVSSAAALEPLKRLIPQVDLKITPQKCGSLHGVLALLERAREIGFSGRVYLGNAGTNTELNSLMLVTLALLINEEVQFSADHKREDGSNIRQVWPQVSVDEDMPMVLSLPAGMGWGARLCKSGLEKRMRRFDFLRPASVAVDPESLKGLMIIRAFDDSTLSVRVLDADIDDDDADEVEGAGVEEHGESDVRGETEMSDEDSDGALKQA